MIEFFATVSYGQIRQYMPADTAYLLPASSWSRGGLPAAKLPSHITRVAADSGGFVAARIWGDYRYTMLQYAQWLKTFHPVWAATMDYCCEDEITTGNTGIVRQRQQRTTDNAWHAFRAYGDVSWPWVPTIQGWDVPDYQRHAQQMRPLISLMKVRYRDNPDWRVGIGTLCARKDTRKMLDIVYAVADALPGVPLHLWGVKLDLLKSKVALPDAVVSVDSAAWVPGGLGRDGHEAREEQQRMGLSQREHMFQCALPRYLNKVEAAVRKPKQMRLL